MRRRAGYLSDSGLLSDTDAGEAGRVKRRYVWLVLASVLGIAGMAGSVAVAGSVGRNAEQKSRAEFESSSAEIASTLELAILHEEDLNLSAATYLSGNPDGSNAQFLQWSESMQAMARYPELTDFGNAVVVPAKDLAAFAARAEGDPWAPLGPSGKFQVEPPGKRPFYCIPTVGQLRNKQVGTPTGQDFCGSGLLPSFLLARDTGKSSYDPFTVGEKSVLGVTIPYYRGGVTPSTVKARRAAFLGWFGTTTAPTMLLDRALQGHPDTAVTFRYKSSSSAASFSSGT
ncbi:MAG: diguanylate cyclase, partial [Kribbellaceae bacterium]|nr:diguanylate cyclase [Kribbellaceae bacterium]